MTDELTKKSVESISCPVCEDTIYLSTECTTFKIKGRETCTIGFHYRCRKCGEGFTTTESDTFTLALAHYMHQGHSREGLKWVRRGEALLPEDETEVFVRYVDASGEFHQRYCWIDSTDGKKRIRLTKDPNSGGYLIEFMKTFEWAVPMPVDVQPPGRVEFTEEEINYLLSTLPFGNEFGEKTTVYNKLIAAYHKFNTQVNKS